MEKHKVSVIMPSKAGRIEHLKRGIEYFNAQTYENKELLVSYDANDGVVKSMLQKGGFTRHRGNTHRMYAVYDNPVSIGARRNDLCAAASGDIILHMDDDDWYSEYWIDYSVNALTSRKADITGLSSLYFYEPAYRQSYGPNVRGFAHYPAKAYEYNYTGSQPYVCGASMCYWKKVWERTPFQQISEGEDALFCANAGAVKAHDFTRGMVAMLHGDNTASHKAIPHFIPRETEVIKSLMGDDFAKY